MELLQMMSWAAMGTGFTFFMTALGAASVFLFRKQVSELAHRLSLGIAAGIIVIRSIRAV